MNRIVIDLKENRHRDIVGRVTLARDSVFVFEALSLVLDEFAKSCGVAPVEIAADLHQWIMNQEDR